MIIFQNIIYRDGINQYWKGNRIIINIILIQFRE